VSTPVLQIIIGSTRPGRIGPKIASWIAAVAAAHPGFEVEVVDLAEVNLPMFDEPNHPMLAQYVHDHTKAWSATVARADAFVFVVPEYNHGINAATKNALDFLYQEWQRKPVGFVSYGGVSAGTRAVQQLKQVTAALRMVAIVEAVYLPFPQTHLDADGVFQAPEASVQAAKAMLDEIERWTTALHPMRQA
jgi:NAD(P)H-dependent FMN reductase